MRGDPMRVTGYVILALAFVLGALALFESMQSPDTRVLFVAIAAGCVLVMAGALYFLPPKDGDR
jgi:hypothetical protein